MSITSSNTNEFGPETSPIGKIRKAALSFGPHAGAHRVALRAAFSIAVPLLILFWLDRMDLSIYASFGSITSLYGRFHYYGDRLRMQLGAGLVFISVMLIGTLLALFDAQITVRIMVVALIATLVTGIAIGFRWNGYRVYLGTHAHRTYRRRVDLDSSTQTKQRHTLCAALS